MSEDRKPEQILEARAEGKEEDLGYNGKIIWEIHGKKREKPGRNEEDL